MQACPTIREFNLHGDPGVSVSMAFTAAGRTVFANPGCLRSRSIAHQASEHPALHWLFCIAHLWACSPLSLTPLWHPEGKQASSGDAVSWPLVQSSRRQIKSSFQEMP